MEKPTPLRFPLKNRKWRKSAEREKSNFFLFPPTPPVPLLSRKLFPLLFFISFFPFPVWEIDLNLNFPLLLFASNFFFTKEGNCRHFSSVLLCTFSLGGQNVCVHILPCVQTEEGERGHISHLLLPPLLSSHKGSICRDNLPSITVPSLISLCPS